MRRQPFGGQPLHVPRPAGVAQGQPPAPPPSPRKVEQKPRKPPRERQEPPPRLPDGSSFHVVWRAKDNVWEGALHISPELAFTAEARAVFTLLAKLDRKYRDFLKKQEKTVAS